MGSCGVERDVNEVCVDEAWETGGVIGLRAPRGWSAGFVGALAVTVACVAVMRGGGTASFGGVAGLGGDLPSLALPKPRLLSENFIDLKSEGEDFCAGFLIVEVCIEVCIEV